jgi:hypothetical protein
MYMTPQLLPPAKELSLDKTPELKLWHLPVAMRLYVELALAPSAPAKASVRRSVIVLGLDLRGGLHLGPQGATGRFDSFPPPHAPADAPRGDSGPLLPMPVRKLRDYHHF